MQMGPVKHVMAAARAYTVVFAVVVVWLLLMPGPFFGPQPDRLGQLIPGIALLAIGWAWLLHIRRRTRQP
jgi:ABC-type transport system involved in cytochrome c biogenesis permease component